MPESKPPNRNDAARQSVIQLAGDLEKCLRAITPNNRKLGFMKLLELHKGEFSDFTSLSQARNIRNCIAHNNPITNAQIQRAEASLEEALLELLRHYPDSLKDIRREAPLRAERSAAPG